jgi:CxxC-x17-CxxC domain-containing protein
MEFTDKILQCVDCKDTFIFAADEQLFFSTKQFCHEPKRCRACRAKRSKGRLRARVETTATCAVCGLDARVPFKPTKGLPVLCRSCFQKPRNPTPDLAACEVQLRA